MAALYFDTSALAKLYHQEAGSEQVEELVSKPGHRLLISRLAVIEMHSVLALKVRSHAISPADAEVLRRKFLADIRDGVFEVLALTSAHYNRAEQLITSYGFRHRLRTLDALQLSVAADLPAGSLDQIVASDRTLCDVAILERLPVLNPERL